MHVTSITNTADGKLYNLNNGDSLLLKEYTTCTGEKMVRPVYRFSDGRSTGARTGAYAATTILPAMAAARRAGADT